MGNSAKHRIVKAFTAGIAVLAVFQLFAAVIQPSCGSYREHALTEKLVVLSAWNDDGAAGGQCLFSDMQTRFKFDAIWAWGWPLRGEDAIPKSSASVAYGFVPWQKKSTAKNFPVKLSAIKKLDINYDFATHGSGKYQTVLKFYLTRSATPTQKDIDTEIVIWLTSQNSKPWPDYEGELDTGPLKYGIWTGKIEGWKFITLQPFAPEQRQGVLDLKAVLNALMRGGHAKEDLYLSSIELGDEITAGMGYSVIREFGVSLH